MNYFDYEYDGDAGVIEIVVDDISEPISVDVETYWKWVHKNSLNVVYNEFGRRMGFLLQEVYWDMHPDIIREHLSRYYTEILNK